MKRFLAIAAAVSLMLSLTACGGRRNNNSDGGSSTMTSDNNSGGTAANGSADDTSNSAGDHTNSGTDKDTNSNDITHGNTESNAPDGFIDPSTGEGAIMGGDTGDTHTDSPVTNDGTVDARMRS